LDQPLRAQLVSFWSEVFDTPYGDFDAVLAGDECHANKDIVYVTRLENQIVSTCHLTVSRCDSRLGGLGEVGTHPQHRGRGFARQLCQQAAAEFDSLDGEALYLGTTNPMAARLYESLGWRYLPRTRVMLRTANRSANNEKYLEQYFQGHSDHRLQIEPGGAQHRILMIPLIVNSDNSTVLDYNAQLLSVRTTEQQSCLRLYPRYQTVARHGQWFAARREQGPMLGIASVRLSDKGAAHVDAFVHLASPTTLLVAMYRSALQWARGQNILSVQTACAEADQTKRDALIELNAEPSTQYVHMDSSEHQLDLMLFDLRT